MLQVQGLSIKDSETYKKLYLIKSVQLSFIPIGVYYHLVMHFMLDRLR